MGVACKRVLIVDDVAMLRAALRELLVKVGLDVVAEAADGDEAVRMAVAHAPDLVFMDVVMPGKSGIEAAREIRRLGLPCRIIICTSNDNPSVAGEAADAGASAFLAKPVNGAKVLDALKMIEDAGR